MRPPSLSQRFASAQQALIALRERDVNLESLIHQPAHSKVVLTKTANSLEILLPPAASTLGGVAGLLFMGVFAIGWNSFIFTWTGFALLAPFPINVTFGLFSLPFWAAGIGMAGGVLFGLWGRVRLTINEQKIHQDAELFRFKRSMPPPSLRQDISKLELTKAFFKRDSDGDRVEVKPQLVIWAGTRKYGYFGSGTLNQPELEWLAQELSLWLHLPIVHG
jgi:hypothetical protein